MSVMASAKRALGIAPDFHDVVFVSTASRPIVENDGAGVPQQKCEVFRAGHRYQINKAHPFIAQWLENRNCYPFGETPPRDPPVIEDFISSELREGSKEARELRTMEALTQSIRTNNELLTQIVAKGK